MPATCCRMWRRMLSRRGRLLGGMLACSCALLARMRRPPRLHSDNQMAGSAQSYKLDRSIATSTVGAGQRTPIGKLRWPWCTARCANCTSQQPAQQVAPTAPALAFTCLCKLMTCPVEA